MLTFSLSLFLINFVSAYNPFSMQALLDSLDPSTAILGSIFILSFALIFFSLTNIGKFKNQRGIAGIISFVISFMIIYFIHRSGMDYQNIYYDLFYNIGLSDGIASSFLPLIILAVAILLIWKTSFATFFMAIGAFIAFYGAVFAYATLTTIIIGGIFIAVGLFIKKNQK